MTQNYTAGWASYVNYGFESTYGTVTTGTRIFGLGQKITHTRRNNMERLFGLSNRNAQANVAKRYEGTASVEFVLSNASFFRAVLGKVADAGSGPSSYTHTYTENITNSSPYDPRVPSFSILTATEMGTNDEVVALIGCKVNSMTLTAAENELVRVRLEVPYKTETMTNTGIGSAVVDTESPFAFEHGLVEFTGGGGSIGVVTSFELTLNNNLEGLWGLSSRYKSVDVELRREYNIRMTVAFNNTATLLEKFYGHAAPLAATDLATLNPAAQATIVLTFNNGVDAIVITLANIYFDEDTLPKSIDEITKEDVTGWALSGTSIVCTNSVSTDAGSP